MTISDGAELNVTHGEFDWSFNLEQMETQTSATMTDVLEGYQLDRGTQQALDGAVGYNYHYDKDIALNMTAAGATEVNNLTLMGGSTYRPFEANTSLNGGMLTLDVTETSKIALDISLDGELYQDDRRQQIVLFSGVDSINYIGVGETDRHAITLSDENGVYYTMAENYFTSEYINPDVYLVWDSSAGVVYLDVIPEPATAMLSLLALAALAARRRRK
ncbi:MAG: PEP-CTERM sorting domain-containing protein [Akkermansia sp.]|nr:PEP-CTERM sorting domain-containing protein [Akkermansia sp.]